MDRSNSYSGLTIIFISFVTIIITFILVLSIGHKALIDETIVSFSLVSIFLFIFLFYGLYCGKYIKNDLNYKSNIRKGYNLLKKGIDYISDATGIDIPYIDIPIINIILGVISLFLFILALCILIYGLSLFIYGTFIIIPCIIYFIMYKAYRKALFYSEHTINNIFKSFYTSLFFTFIYVGWIIIVLFSVKYFMKQIANVA